MNTIVTQKRYKKIKDPKNIEILNDMFLNGIFFKRRITDKDFEDEMSLDIDYSELADVNWAYEDRSLYYNMFYSIEFKKFVDAMGGLENENINDSLAELEVSREKIYSAVEELQESLCSWKKYKIMELVMSDDRFAPFINLLIKDLPKSDNGKVFRLLELRRKAFTVICVLTKDASKKMSKKNVVSLDNEIYGYNVHYFPTANVIADTSGKQRITFGSAVSNLKALDSMSYDKLVDECIYFLLPDESCQNVFSKPEDEKAVKVINLFSKGLLKEHQATIRMLLKNFYLNAIFVLLGLKHKIGINNSREEVKNFLIEFNYIVKFCGIKEEDLM